jgi:hypothetical protein
MFRLKVAASAVLMAALLSACGIAAKPLIGTKHPSKLANYHGYFDDPRTTHIKCLRNVRPKLKLDSYWTSKGHLPAIQVGKPNVGPTLIFYPTAGQVQALQITGHDEGGMAVNSIMLYPNQASAKVLSKVWACTEIIN